MADWMWTMMSGISGMCGPWGLGVLFTRFSWAFVVLGLALLVGWALRRGRPGTRDPAVELLRERFARSDISREEFDARRRDL